VSSTDHEVPHCGVFSSPVTSSLLGPNILLPARSFKRGSKWAVTLDCTQCTRTMAIRWRYD